MRCLVLLLTISGLMVLTVPASAEPIITIGNSNIVQGGTGYVDVMIRSDSSDPLAAFGFDFRISTLGSTRLEFVDPQPYGYLSLGNYVFAGDSYAHSNPPVGMVSTSNVPNDTFIGGDNTLSGTDVSLDNTWKLLTRLELTANTYLPPEVGNTFAIALEPSGSSFFQDAGGTPIDYSWSPGTVTITPVPEPSTIIAVISGGLCLAGIAWHRRRTRHPTLRKPLGEGHNDSYFSDE